MLPIIGVTPLWDSERESIWMLPGYMESIEQAGGLPIILPLTNSKDEITQACSLCSGFLLTGGQDVQPELYNEIAADPSVVTCPRRDTMELQVLHYALQQDRPVLGICRGIQLINTALGGTLYQDVPTQHPSAVQHRQARPYDRPIHRVKLLPGTPLQTLLDKSELAVNSLHHQAIREPAPLLRPMAVSEDGLIEAVYHPFRSFLWAVQWHPEFSFQTDEASRKIFSAFVQAASE